MTTITLENKTFFIVDKGRTNSEKSLVGLEAAKHSGSVRASHPAAPGSILGVPKIFSEIISQKITDVVEIYRHRALLRQWIVQ